MLKATMNGLERNFHTANHEIVKQLLSQAADFVFFFFFLHVSKYVLVDNGRKLHDLNKNILLPDVKSKEKRGKNAVIVISCPLLLPTEEMKRFVSQNKRI